MSTTVEVCNGIAWIEWAKLKQTNLESPLVQCLGRRARVHLSAPIDHEPSSSSSSSKYIRSIGSTAIFLSPTGIASAKSIGPVETTAVEVGLTEQAVVDWSIRLQKEGWKKVVVDPTEVLLDRSRLVAGRTFSILRESVIPVMPFLGRWAKRVPEVAEEAFEIARSIRVEIRVDDEGIDDK